MNLRETLPAKWYYRLTEFIILPWFKNRDIHPNTLTITGMAIALTVPAGFLLHPLAGFFLMLASGIFDTLDGMISRALNKQSLFGSFLDSTTDRISDFFYLTGFWLLFPRDSRTFVWATFGIFSAFLFTVLISYTKARIEGLGGTCNVGVMDRGVRTIYLLVWALLLGIFPQSREMLLWTGLLIYWPATLGSFLQRVIHIKKQCKNLKELPKQP